MKAKQSVAIVGAAAAFATIGLSASAQAAPSQAAVDRNCYSGYFCVYRDSNFSVNNSMYRINLPSDWSGSAPAIYHNDSSWRNRRSGAAYVCDTGVWTVTTISLVSGGEIGYSSAANDRGDESAWNWDC